MKNSKFIKIFTCIGLTVLIAGIVALAILPQKTPEEVLTVYSDGEHYAQTTYYRTEESYVAATGNQLESPANFVMAVEKKVWIIQTEDPSGETLSHPMKEEELTSLRATYLSDQTRESIQTDELYSLTLSLVLTEQDGVYYPVGTANWSKDTFGYVRGAEPYDDDCISLCWGGNRTMQASDNQFTAVDFKGNLIHGSRCVSDCYGGYIWQFRERDSIKKSTIAKEIKVQAAIEKGFGEPYGKTASIKLVYLHTYGKTQTHARLKFEEDEAFVVRSTEKNNWMVELEIDGINY